jgi:GAF domain-containing protein
MPAEDVRLLDFLTATAREIAAATNADACAISRMVGDLLILVAEATSDGSTLQLGQGYLVSDYPQTKRVLETGDLCALTLDDGNVDPAEAAVLHDLGFASLLMLPLELGGDVWGLVEVYRTEPRAFTVDERRIARQRLAELAGRP